jgi:hypothetical protein
MARFSYGIRRKLLRVSKSRESEFPPTGELNASGAGGFAT